MTRQNLNEVSERPSNAPPIVRSADATQLPGCICRLEAVKFRVDRRMTCYDSPSLPQCERNERNERHAARRTSRARDTWRFIVRIFRGATDVSLTLAQKK